jgi:hypothetical protein
VRNDEVMKELDRLDIGLLKPKQKPGESEEAFRQRVKATGIKVYFALVNKLKSDFYQKADDEKKADILSGEITRLKGDPGSQENWLTKNGRRGAPTPLRPDIPTTKSMPTFAALL